MPAGLPSLSRARFTTGLSVPTVDFATHGDLSVSYATALCYWERKGNLCHIFNYLTFTPTFTGAASGALYVLPNLPFTVLGRFEGNFFRLVSSGWPASRTQVVLDAVSATQIGLSGIGAGVAASALGAAHFLTGVAASVWFGGTYQVA